MKTLVITIFILTLGVSSENGELIEPEKKKLKGKWSVASMVTADGKKVSKKSLAGMTVIITENNMIIKDGEDDFEVRYKLHPHLSPAGIDITPLAGPNKGKTNKGIYKLENDVLTLCAGQGADRPKKFRVDKKMQIGVTILLRITE